MKKILIVMAFAGMLFNIAACDNNTHEGKVKSNKEAKKPGKYFCTMHPSVTSDTLGTCPKCGMKLVERDISDK